MDYILHTYRLMQEYCSGGVIKQIILLVVALFTTGCATHAYVTAVPEVVVREDTYPRQFYKVGAHADFDRNIGVSVVGTRAFLNDIPRDQDRTTVKFMVRLKWSIFDAR